MRAIAKMYAAGVARRGYSIIAGGLVTIAAWYQDFAPIAIPIWGWVVAGVFVAQAWAWNDMRRERDKALSGKGKAEGEQGRLTARIDTLERRVTNAETKSLLMEQRPQPQPSNAAIVIDAGEHGEVEDIDIDRVRTGGQPVADIRGGVLRRIKGTDLDTRSHPPDDPDEGDR
jgi:hypothetical protein